MASIMHGMRQRSHYPALSYGELTEILPVIRGRRFIRFESKIDQSAGARACHEWRGGTNGAGYGLVQGSIAYQGYSFLAHRVTWALAHYREPGAAVIRHTCDNPLCCNTRHLRSGSHQDNTNDMIRRGRQPDYASLGRPFDVERFNSAMRLRFADRQPIADVAATLGVHRSTISRWISRHLAAIG